MANSEWRRQHRSGGRPKIDDDPFLRDRVDALLRDHTFSEIQEVLLRELGPERAPSRATIGRYWQRNRDRLLSQQ